MYFDVKSENNSQNLIIYLKYTLYYWRSLIDIFTIRAYLKI